MEATKSVLYVNEDHHKRCETACLDCLLTFDAQDAMSKGLLQRREAYELLDSILSGAPLVSNVNQDRNAEEIAESEVTQPSTQLTLEERLERAKRRQRH